MWLSKNLGYEKPYGAKAERLAGTGKLTGSKSEPKDVSKDRKRGTRKGIEGKKELSSSNPNPTKNNKRVYRC